MPQPLVLAIEPDLRQAAIVKRIVREKVQADVAVVDSRDAALEAMRTTVPDVLLLSVLLSPRDEDELVAHLRSRQDAAHLQTHTIPQLASSFDDDDRPKGLLSAFRRRKGSGRAPTAGCDPDLFAEEIRTYLKRAAEKKREVRDTAPRVPLTARPSVSETVAAPDAAARPGDPEVASSWESPFEWRPSRAATSARPPEPAVAAASAVEEPPAVEAPPFEAPAYEPAALEQPAAFEPAALEPAAFEPAAYEPAAYEPAAYERPVFEPDAFEPAASEPFVFDPPSFESAVDEPPSIALAARPAVRYPLTMRTLRGWWFVEGREAPAAVPDSDLRGILSNLSVPLMVAIVAYADGCYIRRVRLAEA